MLSLFANGLVARASWSRRSEVLFRRWPGTESANGKSLKADESSGCKLLLETFDLKVRRGRARLKMLILNVISKMGL